ncbi:MAG: PEP-CTERM sorting domain-containing protein [Candidatus Eisenbacteria bacterium]|nr:PEP-CTERM sorting domain-containing protein [Candidatus Eisenbacteria bacterium]
MKHLVIAAAVAVLVGALAGPAGAMMLQDLGLTNGGDSQELTPVAPGNVPSFATTLSTPIGSSPSVGEGGGGQPSEGWITPTVVDPLCNPASPVPEPATLTLLGMGVLAMSRFRKR